MRKSLVLLLILLFLTPLVTLHPVLLVHAASLWSAQQVKEYVWVGGDCPIAVDQNNTSHIAYLDGYTLVYASYNGSEWTNQSIATDAIYLIFSLVLDTNGYPHLLYEQKEAGPLMIANWDGKSWNLENTGIAYTDYAALALDSLGNPNIVYTTFTTIINNHEDWSLNTINTHLNYAMWIGTSWNTQTIDTVVNDGLSSISLALGSNNIPYILYSPSSNSSDIKFAKHQGSWTIQTVPLPPSAGNCGNVVEDSKGYLHFICTQPYQNSTTLSTILYASYDGNVWNTQSAASKVPLDTIGSLALDSRDYPHFTYSTSVGETMYLTYSDNIWEIQTLSPSIGVGNLALDSNDNPHLLFRTYSPARYSSHLMYATATEITKSPSPTQSLTVPEATVLAVVAVAIIATFLVAAYAWRKKTSSEKGAALLPIAVAFRAT